MEMKKTYIAPAMEVMEIDIEGQLMALSAEDSLPGSDWGGESEGGMEADANDRRGGWGNLWE